MEQKILYKILMIPAILVAFTVHEYAHGLVAYKLGDKTPKFQGRLTLNPLVHIDIAGFIMILLVGFGWAKPIEVNRSAFKDYYKDDLKVTIAGPLANLITAIIFAVIIGIVSKFDLLNFITLKSLVYIIYQILYAIVSINVVLFVLNMLPVPGFDGFGILMDIFPKQLNELNLKIQRYQMIIIILFLMSPLSDYAIGMPSRIILESIFKIISF